MLLTEGLGRLCDSGAERGVTVEWNADLAAFREAKAASGLGEVTAVFEPERRIGPGFWLALRDRQEGDLVGIQAIRAVVDQRDSLLEHILAESHLYPPVDKAVDPARSKVQSNRAASLCGAIAYHGEFVLHPRMRGRGLGPMFFRFAQALAWQAYRSDVVFGFTGPKNSNPGFAHAMGYSGHEAAAVRWCDGEGDVVEVEGLVWSDASRLEELADDPLGDLEEGGQPVLARAV